MPSFSEAPRDPRQYVRITTDIAMNPKLAVIDDPAASWTYVCSIAYAGGSLTDGHFPVAAVLRVAGTKQGVAKALVEQGLWHLPGHDCDRCPQPKAGHGYVHDFLQHQRSRDEVQDLTDKRRDAGRAGAAARWSKGKKAAQPEGKRIANAEASAEQPLWQDDAQPMASAMANAMPSAMANGWQTDGKAMAEERREEQTHTAPAALPAPAPQSPAPGSHLAVVPDEIQTVGQRANAITRAYVAIEKLSNFPAVSGIVAKAIKADKWTDSEIEQAMVRLATDGRSVTVDALRYELAGPPARKQSMRSVVDERVVGWNNLFPEQGALA